MKADSSTCLSVVWITQELSWSGGLQGVAGFTADDQVKAMAAIIIVLWGVEMVGE